MKLLVLLLLCAEWNVSGQSTNIVDINPVSTNPLYVGPLDMSQLVLPTEPLPVTVFVCWCNPYPFVITNEYTVMDLTVDFQTWYRAYEAPAVTNAMVEVISTNPQTFFRVGNQFGP